MNEEEITSEQIQKVKKIILKNLIIIVMVALIIMSLFVGHRWGYIEGYSYVNDWYESYTARWCVCSELSNRNQFITNEIGLLLTDYDIPSED